MTAKPMDTWGPQPVTGVDVETILREYQQRQVVEHLTGPLISVFLHVLAIGGVCIYFLYAPAMPAFYREVPISVMPLGPDTAFDPPPPTPPEPPGGASLGRLALGPLGPASALANPFGAESAGEESDAILRTRSDPGEPGAVAPGGVDGGGVELIGHGITTKVHITGIGGVPRAWSPRLPAERPKTATIFGVKDPKENERAVADALRWLRQTQNPDGSWSKTQPVAMTGLALLTYLAHFELPAVSKEYGLTVEKAIQYLHNRMLTADGIVEREYSHGIATYALAEAYGLTHLLPLRASVEKGLATIIAGQQPQGGWDYGFGQSARWDLSVSGWQVQALKAGAIAKVPLPGLGEALEKAVAFLEKANYRDGFRYAPESGSTASMQGVGALCMQLLGRGNARAVRDALDSLGDKARVSWKDVKPGGLTTYAWYYQTQAMFHGGPQTWGKWKDVYMKELRLAQKPDGHWETGQAGDAGVAEYDPCMNTCFCALMLQVYYRSLLTSDAPPTAISRLSTGLEVEEGGVPLIR